MKRYNFNTLIENFGANSSETAKDAAFYHRDIFVVNFKANIFVPKKRCTHYHKRNNQ